MNIIFINIGVLRFTKELAITPPFCRCLEKHFGQNLSTREQEGSRIYSIRLMHDANDLEFNLNIAADKRSGRSV